MRNVLKSETPELVTDRNSSGCVAVYYGVTDSEVPRV